MKSRIVVVGSLNADFVINVQRFPVPGETLVGRQIAVFPGGKGANQAYAAGKLGADVAMVGQVGNDAQGPWLRQNLASAGVDVSAVIQDPSTSSGVASITTDAAGQNEIIIVPGANGAFGRERLGRSAGVIASAGLVLLQLEIPLETVQAAAEGAQSAGAVVMLDPAPAQPLPDSLLHRADYLTPNETELCILTGTVPRGLNRDEAASLARQLLRRGVKKVLVKLGAQGALLLGANQEHFWPARPVKPVDTTAAGDAFNAAFAVALAEGRSEQEAGPFATAAAAFSVTRPGAQPSMPNRAEVENMLRS